MIKRRAPTAGGGVRDPPALLRSSARGGRDPPALIRTRGGGVVACLGAGPPPSMRTAPAISCIHFFAFFYFFPKVCPKVHLSKACILYFKFWFATPASPKGGRVWITPRRARCHLAAWHLPWRFELCLMLGRCLAFLERRRVQRRQRASPLRIPLLRGRRALGIDAPEHAGRISQRVFEGAHAAIDAVAESTIDALDLARERRGRKPATTAHQLREQVMWRRREGVDP